MIGRFRGSGMPHTLEVTPQRFKLLLIIQLSLLFVGILYNRYVGLSGYFDLTTGPLVPLDKSYRILRILGLPTSGLTENLSAIPSVVVNVLVCIAVMLDIGAWYLLYSLKAAG